MLLAIAASVLLTDIFFLRERTIPYTKAQSYSVTNLSFVVITYFVLFPNPRLMPNQPLYWFMMQIGMVLGFFTSYPMNRVLIKWGTKEAMG